MTCATAADVDLAAELFEEENWTACRRECLRVLAGEPGHDEARLFGALAGLRSGLGPQCVETLRDLASDAQTQETRALAAYEVGCVDWVAGDTQQAYRYLKAAYEQASSHELFLRAGCSLHILIERHPELVEDDPGLRSQLKTSRSLWRGPLWRECDPARQDGAPGWLSLPARCVVAFYRAQIAPAIGGRCSLEPSCSEYFRQVSHKHGLLGVPMQADRFIREPDVVKARQKPLVVNGRTRYADPVSDHDWWMGE